MKKIIIILISFLLLTGLFLKNQNSEQKDDLSKFFDGYEGVFILYDQNNNKYSFYNEEKIDKPISPCSTFKIFNSLIALESKVIENEKVFIKWSGKKYEIKSWNRDHNMASAIANSVVWFYQELASRTGKDRMQKYLNKLDYGNKDISGGITKFWLESSLKISPREQLELLKKFHKKELSFSDRNMNIVKKIIVLSDKNDIKLSGKTGTGIVNGKPVNGWFIGYVEKDNNIYFFVTNIKSNDAATGSKSKEITIDILKNFNILEKIN